MTRGLLHEIKLHELIQFIGLSDRTGVLELTPLYPRRHRPAQIPTGQIFFREGLPHAAFVADRVGQAAAENLFLWEAGFFVFHAIQPNDLPPENITQEVDGSESLYKSQSLVFRGVNRMHQWHVARSLVPTLRAVLQPKPPQAGASPSPLDERDPASHLLALCDGYRQIDAQAQMLGWGRLRCREVAARLLADDYVVYGPMSMGEQLVRAIAELALPTLGIAADLFCDDALRACGMAPEHIGQIQQFAIMQVQQVISEMEADVGETLDPMRAEALARHLCHGLRVPYVSRAEVRHV